MRSKLDLLSSETSNFLKNRKKLSMQRIPLKRGSKVDVFTELKKLLKKNLEGVATNYLIHLAERYKTISGIFGKGPEPT